MTDDGSRTVSRRSLLRVAKGAAPAGALALLYGAGHLLSERNEATWQRSVSEADPDLTGEAFTAYVGKMAEKYGPRGVWGLRRVSAAGLRFVGAWTLGGELAVDHPLGAAYPTVTDSALVLFRAGTREDRVVHRLWLWSGALVRGYPRGLDNHLTRLAGGVSLDAGRMGAHVPEQPRDAGEDVVMPAGGDPRGPGCERASASGTLRPDAERTARGDGGAFGVEWVGSSVHDHAVHGACELERPRGESYTFAFRTAVAGRQKP